MSKKSILIISIIASGLCLLIIGFALLGFDIRKLDTGGVVKTSTYTTQNMLNLEISDLHTDIEFEKSPDQQIHITYGENNREKYIIEERNDTLSIIKKENRQWYDYIFNINIGSQDLIIELPENYQQQVNLVTTHGDISFDDVSLGDLELSTTHGEVSFNDVLLGELELSTSHGEVDMSGLVVNKSLNIVTTHESIYFKDLSVSQDIEMSTTHSDITGSLLGNINDYTISSSTSHGNNNLPERSDSGTKRLDISTTHGDIDVEFEQ